MKKYEKNEFCKAFNCSSFVNNECKCVTNSTCRFTAKEFHKYLESKNYKIMKEDLEDEKV